MINLASCITISRIVLTPVVIVLLCQQWWAFAALVFVVAALTDLLDGFVARRFNQQTRFGQLLDPVADKCLLMGTMYTLLMVMQLSGWYNVAVYFLLAKEMVLLGVGGFLIYRYNFFILPSALSRVVSIAEMMLVLIILSYLILFGYAPFMLLSWVLLVNVLLSVWLLVRYVGIIQNYLRNIKK